MDSLTAAVNKLRNDVISAINNSRLPAVVVDLVLTDILRQVQSIENGEPDVKSPEGEQKGEEMKEG